jgi:putative addiction module CopG family antidote
MTALTIFLPEDLTAYLQAQIAAGHYTNADDYIQALIQQDKARKEYLEALILEGFASGNAAYMTEAEWDTIHANVHQSQRECSQSS